MIEVYFSFAITRFIAMFITAVCVLFHVKLRWPKKNTLFILSQVKFMQQFCNNRTMDLHNDFTRCTRRGWELGTEDNVLNFESAIMRRSYECGVCDFFIDLPRLQLLSLSVVVLALYRFHCPNLRRRCIFNENL